MSLFFQENQWGERFIPEVNRDGFSAVPSADYYSACLDLDVRAEYTLHVVVGSDSGLLIKYLSNISLGAGSAVLIIDTDEVCELVAQEYAQLLVSGDSVENVRLLAASEWQNSFFDGRDSNWFLSGEVRLIQSHGCRVDYLQSYFSLYRDVRVSLDERRIDLQQRCSRRQFIDVQMLNATDNVTPFPVSAEFGRNKVAVVMAGGPSLDQHIAWIKKNRSKLFLVAVSRLCQKLELLDLVPDVVTSIDSMPQMYDVSKHGTLWHDVPLINSYHVAPGLLQQWGGPHYYIGERLPWDGDSSTSTATLSSTGDTVSHTAVLVAAQLGFSTILMAGVDLCYSTMGSTHAQGTPEAEILKLPSQYDAQVTTYSGRRAGTSMVLYRTLDNLDMLGKMINRRGPRLFSISQESAAIPSITCINRRAVKLVEKKPVWQSGEYAPSVRSLDALDQQLAVARQVFESIERTCRYACRCLDHINGENGFLVNDRYALRLQALEKKLVGKNSYLEAVKYYVAYELAQLERPIGLGEMNDNRRQSWGGEHYELFRKTAERYQILIESALRKSGIRRLELQENVDISVLLDCWEKDGTPGRVLRFERSRSQELSCQQRRLFSGSRDNYLKSVKQKSTEFSGSLDKYVCDIDNCIRSVVFLYNQKSLDDLLSLSRTITMLTWPGNAVNSFVKGLAGDLESNGNEALFHFQAAVEKCCQQLGREEEELAAVHRLLEETLSRMTQIYLTMGDAQSAVSTLATLCEFRPKYIPAYAELLSTLGNQDNAVGLLTMYIENLPEDWQAARQLAQLHESMGAVEKARIIMAQADLARYGNGDQQHRRAA